MGRVAGAAASGLVSGDLIEYNQIKLFGALNASMFNLSDVIPQTTGTPYIRWPRDTTFFYIFEYSLNPVVVRKIDKTTLEEIGSFTMLGSIASPSLNIAVAANGNIIVVDSTNTTSIVVRRYYSTGTLHWSTTLSLSYGFRAIGIQYNDLYFGIFDGYTSITTPLYRRYTCSAAGLIASPALSQGTWDFGPSIEIMDDGSFIARQSNSSYINYGMGHFTSTAVLRKLIYSGNLSYGGYAFAYNDQLWCDGTYFIAHVAGPANDATKALYQKHLIASTSATPSYQLIGNCLLTSNNGLFKYDSGNFKEVTITTGVTVAGTEIEAPSSSVNAVVVLNKKAIIWVGGSVVNGISIVAEVA